MDLILCRQDAEVTREATILFTLEAAGRCVDLIGPRVHKADLEGDEQWWALHCLDRLADVYTGGPYLRELIGLTAQRSRDSICNEYQHQQYHLTMREPFDAEHQRMMTDPGENGFYVATQVAAQGYLVEDLKAVEAAIERLRLGCQGETVMHVEYELQLGMGMAARLRHQPVMLSHILPTLHKLSAAQRLRANFDLEFYFGITWASREPGQFQ